MPISNSMLCSSVIPCHSGRRARSAAIVLFALALVFPFAGWAGAMELVGRVGGKCSSIAHQANHALVCEGSGLAIFDDSGPGNPLVVERLQLDALTTCIRLYSDVAYVGTEDGRVRLFDVSTPASPALLGTITGHGALREALFDGIYAYLATGDGVQILDISDPSSPIELSFTAIAGNIADLALRGTKLYVPVGQSISVIDVTDRTTPTSGESIALPPYPNSFNVPFGTAMIASRGDFLHVIWNVSLPDFAGIVITRLATFDLAASPAPELLSAWDGPRARATDLVVADDRAFVASHGHVQIIDLGNPALPVEEGHLAIPVFDGALALEGDTLRIAHTGGWLGLDVANPTTISIDQRYGFTDATFVVSGLAISGGLCAAYRGGNVLLMDINEPSRPTILSGFSCSELIVDAAMERRLYVTSHRDAGIQIHDVSSPETPVLVGTLAPLTGVAGVHHGELALSGGIATVSYTAGTTGNWIVGVLTIDLSNPATPLLIGHASTQATGRLNPPFLARRGNEACLSSGLPGEIYFFGLSSPDSPEWLSTFDGLQQVLSLTWGNNLVAASTIDGTYLVSAGDVGNPSGLGLVTGSAYGRLMCLDGMDRLYSITPTGLAVEGVAAPQAPVALDSLVARGGVTGTTIDGGLVYTYDRLDGLLIARTGLPDHLAQRHLLGSDTGAADQNGDGVIDAADFVLAMAAARE